MAEVRYYFSDSSFNEEDEKFFSKYAKNRLISYHYHSSLKKYIEIYRKFNGIRLDVSEYNLLIDSGAYSIWNSGKPPIDVHDYKKFCLEFLLSIRDLPFKTIEFINLDQIPGQRDKPVTRDDVLFAQDKSLENYLILKNYVPNLLPVFHQGDDFNYLKIIEENTLRYCVSPANDKSVQQRLMWIGDVFKKANPKFKPHGLGFSNSTIAKANPWFSFDASTHALRAGFGVIMYKIDDKLLDIVVSDVRTPQDTGTHFKNFTSLEQKKILDDLFQVDPRFTYENIVKQGKIRKMINVYNVSEYYKSFTKPSNLIQETLF
jgi:hypothetical protein